MIQLIPDNHYPQPNSLDGLIASVKHVLDETGLSEIVGYELVAKQADGRCLRYSWRIDNGYIRLCAVTLEKVESEGQS